MGPLFPTSAALRFTLRFCFDPMFTASFRGSRGAISEHTSRHRLRGCVLKHPEANRRSMEFDKLRGFNLQKYRQYNLYHILHIFQAFCNLSDDVACHLPQIDFLGKHTKIAMFGLLASTCLMKVGRLPRWEGWSL